LVVGVPVGTVVAGDCIGGCTAGAALLLSCSGVVDGEAGWFWFMLNSFNIATMICHELLDCAKNTELQ
jgi:hypothetical protein